MAHHGGCLLGVMRVTKLEHATLKVEHSGSVLVIDPGVFTTPLPDQGGVVAIVITHEHPDHWTADQLSRLITRNPDVVLFGPQGVADAASAFPIEVVAAGDLREVGPFTLEFFGAKHAVIHESIPVPDNVGVLVNRILFYPGDAFTVPSVEVDTLAVPAGAPWLKLGEAMDYVTAVAPKRAFGNHDMTLSTAGRGMHSDRLKTSVESVGGEWFPLEPGGTLDI